MTATPARQKALGTVPDGMTKDEWQMRVDLAACYQLTAKYGWSHMTGTHISARIPNTDDHFLLNLRVDYRLTKHITLFAAGENLLDEDYEYRIGYPMPGATVMGGVEFRI